MPSPQALKKQLEKLVPAWFDAKREMSRMTSDDGASWLDEEPMEAFLGKPCKERDIQALEKKLGHALPASYRAYLSLFGDKKGLAFPLGAAQHGMPDVRNELREKSDLFDEFADANPIDAGGIPFEIGDGSRRMLLFVPPLRKSDEMDLVYYDLTEEQHRYPSLVEYFEASRKLYAEIAERERKAKARGGVQTTRDAIAITIAAGEGRKPSAAALKATVKILGGSLRGGSIPLSATITSLASREEGARFVAGLCALAPMPEKLARSLADEAVELLEEGDTDERAKAAAVVELFRATAPKRGWSASEKEEWLDGVARAATAATSAKEKGLAKKLVALRARHAPKGDDIADVGSITTHREAIDAVLAFDKSKKVPAPAILRRIVGCLGATWPPNSPTMVERTIEQLSGAAESERFVAALRKLPVPRSLIETLAYAATDLMTDKKRRAKAFPLLDLMVDLAPTKPCRNGDPWIYRLNNAIYWAVELKDAKAALRYSELAIPHAAADPNVPHNAACGLAMSKRYDDALEMCRLAVKKKYKDLAKLRVDKLLGPLRDRDDFKALFAKKR